MTPCKYSMYAADQCPRVLAWMVALSAAAGRDVEARQWIVELVGCVVERRESVRASA